MPILFIGSYTEMIAPNFGGHGEGIYAVALNDITGELKLLNTTQTTNASYLAISEDQSFLYAVKEVASEKKPVIKAFKINKDHTLQFLNEQSISGSLPCHIEYYNASVIVACYGTGNVLKYPLDSNGALLNCSHDFKHNGSSINKERQEAPHAHQTCIHPKQQVAFVPDLGIDKVKAYTLDTDFGPLENRDITIPKGLGPRHLVFNSKGNIGYLINELTAAISILKKDNTGFKFYKNVKSLPDSFTETPSASAIRIHPNQNYLYAANRTLEAISIFKIIEDDLQLIAYQFTKGKTLREFNISPNGQWLIACLQDSDETIVYAINPDGTLSEKHRTHSIVSPVCVAFL